MSRMSKKKKVFVLIESDMERQDILGVFLFRERAESELEKYLKDYYGYYRENLSIEEMDLDGSR